MLIGSGSVYPFVFAEASPLLAVMRTLEKVRDNSTTVLIEGESGTGKDALAQWLHFTGSRKSAPCIKIDFASVPDELVESELFGHERGAFTGAIQTKQGKLDVAQGGTVILDEIGNADLAVQAKLLNVVEEKQFYRVGGNRPIEMDSRIVVLSSFPLAKAVERGIFRQDLFFRLNLITVQIPPLRERRPEIVPIARQLVLQLGRKYKTEPQLLSECSAILEAYDFPGNVRELRNGLERAILISSNQQITSELLPAVWQRTSISKTSMPTLEDVERDYIAKVLRETRGKKVKAAKILGISRKTLLEKRKRYSLD